jgi:hypothetical protein
VRVADVDLARALVDEEPLVLVVVDVPRGAHTWWRLDIDHAVLASSFLGADLDCCERAEQPEVLAFFLTQPVPELRPLPRCRRGHQALLRRYEQLVTFVVSRSMSARGVRIATRSPTLMSTWLTRRYSGTLAQATIVGRGRRSEAASPIELKGFSRPITAYEIVGLNGDLLHE